MTDARASRVHVEALVKVAVDARLSRQHIEVLYDSVAKIQLGGTIPRTTGDFALAFPAVVTLAGQIPAVTGDFTINSTSESSMQLAGTIPAVTGAFTVDIPDDPWRDTLLDVADGDLMYWARHNEAGTVLKDSSGGGHHGTITHRTNGPTVAPPLVGTGGAIDFGGNNAFDPDAGTADVPDGGWFDPSDGLTIGFWIDMPGGSTTSQQRILHKAGSFDIYVNALGTINFGIVGTTGDTSTIGPITNGVHLVIVTIDDAATLTGPGGGLMHAYLDARAINGPGSGATHATAVDPAKPIAFGYQPPGSSQPPFGAMDETFMIRRPLTLAEVQTLFAALPLKASLAGTIPATTGAFHVDVAPTVTLGGTIPRTTGAFTIETRLDVALAGTIPATTGAFTVTRIDTVTLDGQIPAVTGAFTVKAGEIALAATIQRVMGSFAILRQEQIVLAGTIPAVTGAFTLTGSYQLQLAGTIPAVTGAFAVGFPPQSDTGNRASGRIRSGLGIVFYEPPVAEPPDFSIAQHAFVSARAYTSATMAGTRPVFAGVVRKQAKRARDRILVGGVDITFFRDVATPAPSYGLVVPLLYGSGQLPLPQVSAAFEQPGVGALAWARRGAKVLVQRVDPDTNAVLATDYIGLVVAHDVSGRNLVLELGGEATGRAALIDKQPPLFFKRNDLGFWWWGAIQELGLRFEPRLGPDVGIRLRNAGGMDHLSYIQDLSAKGTRRNGTQLTCMPDAREDGGAYRVVEKDLETVHATVYLDDAVTVADVRADLAEEPNRVYATGVTPEGMRVKFGAYPLLRDATPPPYPFNDGRLFDIGTTDGDTDTGDGVSVMIWRLTKAGYLALIDKPGGYDADVADAIRDLKADALSGTVFIDGRMSPQAWAALFDSSATGVSIAGTQILPAAQRSKTRKWNRTQNGSVISLNDDYDPTVIPVDATIDTGVGMTRRQIRGFARGELAPVGENHWAGTITLYSGAAIAGDHTPGDPITEDDVFDARAFRPGMNLSAPLFAGGTLFHVSGVDRRVNDDGQTTISLDVDTRARDTMKVWAVIARNRESRRNPARAWLNQHRSSSLTKDAVGEFDEIGGVLDDRVDLAGGAWTVFTTVAGDEGQIRSLELQTNPPTEFVTAVFGQEITPAQLVAAIGNPLTKGGKKRWVDEAVRARLDDDHVLLYAVGEKRDPCGYSPAHKHEDPLEIDDSADDATEGPNLALLTGKWEDDAGFPYRGLYLYVAIWAAEDTHLSPGRIMWPQRESGS